MYPIQTLASIACNFHSNTIYENVLFRVHDDVCGSAVRARSWLPTSNRRTQTSPLISLDDIIADDDANDIVACAKRTYRCQYIPRHEPIIKFNQIKYDLAC